MLLITLIINCYVSLCVSVWAFQPFKPLFYNLKFFCKLLLCFIPTKGQSLMGLFHCRLQSPIGLSIFFFWWELGIILLVLILQVNKNLSFCLVRRISSIFTWLVRKNKSRQGLKWLDPVPVLHSAEMRAGNQQSATQKISFLSSNQANQWISFQYRC